MEDTDPLTYQYEWRKVKSDGARQKEVPSSLSHPDEILNMRWNVHPI